MCYIAAIMRGIKQGDIFKLVRGTFTAFKLLINGFAQSNRVNEEANDKSKEVKPSIPATISISDFPVEATEYYKSRTRKHPRSHLWRNTKRFLEVSGIAIALGIAILTNFTLKQIGKQATAAQGQLDVNQRQFRIDQRAWISPHIINQFFAEGKPLAIFTEFSNTGKTPAIKVKTCQVAEIIGRNRKDVDISCPESAKSPGFGVLFPQSNSYRMSNAAGNGGKAIIEKDGLLRNPLMDDLRHREKVVLCLR